MYVMLRRNRTISIKKVWYQSSAFNNKTYYVDRIRVLSKKIKEANEQDIILKTNSLFMAKKVQKFFDTPYHREYTNQKILQLIPLFIAGKLK